MASNPKNAVTRVYSAFQVCSFRLLCSLQSFTGRNLAGDLASAQYHFAFHGQWLALSEVSPRFSMLSRAQQKTTSLPVGSGRFVRRGSHVFIDDTTMLTIYVPPPWFEPPPGGARVVDDTSTVCWLYLLYIIPKTFRPSNGGSRGPCATSCRKGARMLSLPDTTTCAQYLHQMHIVQQRTGGVFRGSEGGGVHDGIFSLWARGAGASPHFGYRPPPLPPSPPRCRSIATGHTYGGAKGARKFFFIPLAHVASLPAQAVEHPNARLEPNLDSKARPNPQLLTLHLTLP